MNTTQSEKVGAGRGFFAALDQSGGSTPKALAEYGIGRDRYSSDAEMFDLVHAMRTRVVTSPAFDGSRILAAILFEQTMERDVDGVPTARYLWDEKNVVPFLKVDLGLAPEQDGVQLMKPIDTLDDLLERAQRHQIFGTKMRSVINDADEAGISAIVDQQFDYASRILAVGLVPIIEPEVSISSPHKEQAEMLLHDAVSKHVQALPDGATVILKITIPTRPGLYGDLASDPRVLRVVALSGGYSRDEACARLARDPTLIASFSRALLEGLTESQTDEQFNAQLESSIEQIYQASVHKQPIRPKPAEVVPGASPYYGIGAVTWCAAPRGQGEQLSTGSARVGSAMNRFALSYGSFDPAEEGLREALTSTGNGYLCSRGAAEWEDADGVHYPGTYVHGVYNRETTILGGLPVLNEDLVNVPNWLVLKLRIEGADVIRLADVELLEYRHELDLHRAVVTRELRFLDAAGRETALRSRRFVSMADPHRAAIEWTLTPRNWSGRVEVISAIDGRVTNQGVARYLELEGRHLNPVSPRTFGAEIIALKVQTRQSNIYLSQAARTRVFQEDEPPAVERSLHQMEDYIQQVLAFDVQQGTPTRVEKMLTFSTSRDAATSDTLAKAGTSVRWRPDFEEELERHVSAWEELWRVCDVRVRGDERVQLLLRLHVCHVLQVCSRHTADLDAGVPARGLNGEAYRGHVFWDELYVLPFLTFRLPTVTRELLMYRYRRLDEARAAAAEAGFRGAMFPWQSGSEGKEETQRLHLNPLSGLWEPDLSRIQRHVNAAIFYNIWHYFQATRDLAFLRDNGAEMMVEIARFWASIAWFNPDRERYEIHGVMGPDEFHEKYPDAQEGGLRNNAYTNVMVAWLCELAGEVLSLLPASRADALRARLKISEQELSRWQDMSRRMFVPFHGDGIISQFEGYEALEELDWDAYRAKYGNIQRLDRILRAEGKDPNRYKIAKQADTVMLFFLFSPSGLRRLFERLGYEYRADTAARNIAYYDQRTSHGSTLSFVTYAGVLAALDPDSSWERFLVALNSDVEDVQGGTTREGIHMGVMAGTLDLMQRAYLGTEIRDEVLYFEPRLPGPIEELSFTMQFRRAPLLVTFSKDSLTLALHPEGASEPVKVGAAGEIRELCPGDRHVFRLSPATPTAGRSVDG